jgi:hypothetical protein
MIRVRDTSQYCPADAPVVLSVSPDDIEKKKGKNIVCEKAGRGEKKIRAEPCGPPFVIL